MSSNVSGCDVKNLSNKCYTENDVNSINLGILRKIAKLYADIFADPPWNEYMVCPNKHYSGKGIKEQELCNRCNMPLELAYPEDRVINSIIKNACNKQGGCLSVFENVDEIPHAAGWGSTCSLDKFCAKYYKTQEMRQVVSQKIDRFMKNKEIFYLSEIFVAPEARGQGIGTSITNALMNRARELNLNIIFLTHCDSPMARIAKKCEMLPIINVGEDLGRPKRILYGRVL